MAAALSLSFPDRPDLCYSPGEAIRGTLHVENNEPIKMRGERAEQWRSSGIDEDLIFLLAGVKIRFKGEAEVRITRREVRPCLQFDRSNSCKYIGIAYLT